MSNKQLLAAIRKDVRRIVKEEIQKGKRVTIYPSDLMMKELPALNLYNFHKQGEGNTN